MKRNVRNFICYKVINEDNTPRKLWKRVNIEYFNDIFKPNNYFSKVGFTPDYVGVAPGKILNERKMNNILLRYIHNNKTTLSRKFPNVMKQWRDSMREHRFVLDGSLEHSYDHLKGLLSEDIMCKINRKDLIKIVSLSKMKWLEAPVVEYSCSRELFYLTNFNKNGATGHYTSKLISQKRSGSIAQTSVVAHQLLSILQSKPIKNFYLWQVLGREKDNKMMGKKEVASRVILNTEEPMTILLSYFANKINKSFKNSDTTRIVSAKKVDMDVFEKIEANKEKFDFYIETDWSNFDASVSPDEILVACALLLSRLKDDKFHNRIFYLIASSLITKYVLIPPGIVVELNKAVPSGTPFTNLIVGYINMIRWMVIGYSIYGENYEDFMEILVVGDDANVFFKNTKKFQSCNIDKICAKNFKLKTEMNGTMCPCKTDVLNFDKTPDFLKRRTRAYGVEWNLTKVFDRINYQTKLRTNDEQIELLLNYAITAPHCDEFNEFVVDVCASLSAEEEGTYDVYKYKQEYTKKIEKFKIEYGFDFKNRDLQGYKYEKAALTSLNQTKGSEPRHLYRFSEKKMFLILCLGFNQSLINKYRRVICNSKHYNNNYENMFDNLIMKKLIPK